ncbi:IS630 transposase-related protein [Alicyclobacillus tolerans]|uniref:IS630 transposase-related protein n=1 Tax=Alicyclobacillus tolerans TaxID=90970 RepID=UPI003B78AC06
MTDDLQRKIVEAIRAGNYIETAAAYAGVNKSTIYDWLKRGARGDGAEFVSFSNAVEKALAEAEMRDVLIIGNAAKENWQAAAWRLERKFPERWGRKDRMNIQADVNAKVVFVDDLGDESEEDQS